MEVKIIDAHTHLQKLETAAVLERAILRASEAGVIGAVVCGTSPQDWEQVKGVFEGNKNFKIFPGYGVHPWYVKGLEEGWEEKLRRKILEDENAHVGEIGLDKHFPNLADIERQKEVMMKQLEIAKEFGRPVTVHCVKAQAEVMEVLKKTNFNKSENPIILHSFNGNLEQLEQWNNAKFSDHIFFSVNCKFNRDNVLRKIPIQKLLLETDAPDQLPSDASLEPLTDSSGAKINEPAQIRQLLARVAAVRGVSESELAAAVLTNTRRAFRIAFFPCFVLHP